MRLVKVFINGFDFYVDSNLRIVYSDNNRNSGVPFNYMTSNELKQVEDQLRFPRKERELI